MKRLLFTALAALSISLPAAAGEISEIQAEARPYGLEPIAPVQLSGSDDRSAEFNRDFLPQFQKIVKNRLSERVDFSTQMEGFRLDASRLFLRTESDKPIRIYFIHEGAGYHNSLGMAATPAGAPEMGEKGLIFPDASFFSPRSTRRTANVPLVAGDFVELGTGAPGIQLDFFCIADGARMRPGQDKTTWYNNVALNPDGYQHVVAFLLPGSRYVMIGFEDLWYLSGDKDYNDVVFVVDIGETNAESLFDVESTLPN